MSDLGVRAPDPTLTAMPYGAWAVIEWGNPATAHAISPTLAHPPDLQARCGGRTHAALPAADAAYIAAPCRDCFPDAPPPGTRPIDPNDPDDVYGTDGSTDAHVRDPYLAWQITDMRHS